MAKKELTVSDTPKRDAEILLTHVTGKSRSYLIAFGETNLTSTELKMLEKMLIRRKAGEPIAYLIGEKEFWSLPFYVSSITLIPRPDTECLVEQALKRLPSKAHILDLGTGTGAIALSLAYERPDCSVVAVDLLPDVVELANRNVVRLGLKNVSIRQGSWFDSVSGEMF